MASPYTSRPEAEWLGITKRLVSKHPLSLETIRESALTAWKNLWKTKLGRGKTAISLSDLKVPATVIGYFFEVLLARELEMQYPNEWRGCQAKGEKDLVFTPDTECSVEVKSSGQLGRRVYGNRSYGQKSVDTEFVGKEKSGFYITVNFYGSVLTLLRFGWIDGDDWIPQKSQTGQMAGLSKATYEHKLIPISGKYRTKAPIELLDGVGPTVARNLHDQGVDTIGDLIQKRTQLESRFSRVYARNENYLEGCQ